VTGSVRSAGYEVKAAAFRGYIVQIEKLGVLAAVTEKVPADTRRAMESPPLPSAWIDAIFVEDMIEALQSLLGIKAVRTVTIAGQKAGPARILMPLAGALLRIFGTKPDTLLARFPDVTKTVIRGVDFKWILETPTSGYLKIIFRRKNVPRHVFIGMESGCWLTLELCNAKGTVADTEIVNEGSTGIIRVSWA
jgi:hypothetical protein